MVECVLHVVLWYGYCDSSPRCDTSGFIGVTHGQSETVFTTGMIHATQP